MDASYASGNEPTFFETETGERVQLAEEETHESSERDGLQVVDHGDPASRTTTATRNAADDSTAVYHSREVSMTSIETDQAEEEAQQPPMMVQVAGTVWNETDFAHLTAYVGDVFTDEWASTLVWTTSEYVYGPGSFSPTYSSITMSSDADTSSIYFANPAPRRGDGTIANASNLAEPPRKTRTDPVISMSSFQDREARRQLTV